MHDPVCPHCINGKLFYGPYKKHKTDEPPPGFDTGYPWAKAYIRRVSCTCGAYWDEIDLLDEQVSMF